MATSSKSVDDCDWRKSIILQLQNVCKVQSSFEELIALHNRLLERSNTLKSENLQLTIQNEKLRIENLELQQHPSGSGDRKPNEKIQALEQKLLLQQEELTELHRRKGDNAQQLLDLNHKLHEKEKQLSAMQVSLADSMAVISSLRVDIQLYQNKIKELESINQIERDEHQALSITFVALEEKLKKSQDENRTLVERLMRYKSKDADKLNEENENFVRKRQAKLQKELEEAAKEARPISPERQREGSVPFFTSTLPTKVTARFDAHEGEVHAVKWSPVDRPMVATGGADRKVKLWDISKAGQHENKGMLVGSNAAVMSVDFDSSGTNIIGASVDFSCRIWTVEDRRLRERKKRNSWSRHVHDLCQTAKVKLAFLGASDCGKK
ncbi:autophagy-related protein 16-1 isoform X2 [Anabrus simplex]|uniref:autophagy-related protein 16-1 isoform X2 n=1 Tax=Anabrus simplex TaxID=316456 RepID=UPI0035A30335